jgi:hypothetical protein
MLTTGEVTKVRKVRRKEAALFEKSAQKLLPCDAGAAAPV